MSLPGMQGGYRDDRAEAERDRDEENTGLSAVLASSRFTTVVCACTGVQGFAREVSNTWTRGGVRRAEAGHPPTRFA